ncbi:hypothetical protein LCGC14_0891740 [marine sediment metagenome]|uniref:Uncharacterized protein n=1 Tax=marine sediment metagenome TaxID=412755 RepID=A0A0F9S5Z8_9ZZZZ
MAELTESNDSNTADSGIMNVEFVQFSSLDSGDYFDCKKLREVETAFACQSTTDGIEIQCSWDTASPPRVTLTLSSGSSIKGYLVVIGRM